jgi:uncharacterized protein YndB with AHSA1/START domain
MENQTLDIKTALQIQKPVNEVFEAIVDPDKMSNVSKPILNMKLI